MSIEVTVQKPFEPPAFELEEKTITVPSFKKLTPRAARAALKMAFGAPHGGYVWWQGYGYRVYENTARRIVR